MKLKIFKSDSRDGGRRAVSFAAAKRELGPTLLDVLCSFGSLSSGTTIWEAVAVAPVGRPALPIGQDASSHIHLRVKPAVKARYNEAARKAGLTLSEWILAACDNSEWTNRPGL